MILDEVEGKGLVIEGVNGSLVRSGKEDSCPGVDGDRNSIVLTKTTWQFSGLEGLSFVLLISRQHSPPIHQRPSRSTLSSTLEPSSRSEIS